MFPEYMIIEDTLKNVEKKGKVCGFQFDFRLPYYRSIMISCMDSYSITVDGKTYDEKAIRVSIRGCSYDDRELQEAVDVRAAFGEIFQLVVEKDGGLASGEHEVTVNLGLRVSYMPWILKSSCTRKMQICEEANV